MPKLNNEQLKQLAGFISNMGLIYLGTVVGPAVVDQVEPIMVVLGILMTVTCLFYSLWILKKGK